jgi:type IX secretion system PorP/SprF family membrane protein
MKRLVTILLIVTLASKTHAQDLHFSQFFNSPLTTNPANTGFIPDADYRLGVNYRNQFSSIMAQPYRTYSAWADFQLLRNKIENGWLGIGAVLLGDKVGSGALTSNKFYGSVAYHQMLGQSSLLSAGFNLGYVSKRIQPRQLSFPDQFDGKFFDRFLPTTVNFAATSINYFDMQVGLNYAYFPTDDLYFNGGYSIHHVNQPNESFFNDGNAKVSMRHIGFVNALIKTNSNVIINPNAYYTNQAGASELVFGANVNYNLSEAGQQQLIAGLYHRWKDAIAPVLGIEYNRTRIMYSYDATISNLSSFNNTQGAHEISLVYKGFYPDSDKGLRCPLPTF